MADFEVQAVRDVQDQVTAKWMERSEVLGTAVGINDSGDVALILFIDRDAPQGVNVGHDLVQTVRGAKVQVRFTDKFRAQQHTAEQTPPVQLGTSGGWTYDFVYPYCCGGTLGSLVNIGGIQYILSNWHVLEYDSVYGGNNAIAQTGDPIIQPGLIDVNCVSSSAQVVGTLAKKKRAAKW